MCTSDSAENSTKLLETFYKNENEFDVVLEQLRDPLYIVVPITIIYVIILLTGIIGNVSTCIVITKNKSMHTATNYYLFSLAISDLLLLISGLPPEMYKLWWPQAYIFGNIFCMIQSFSAETSANATVLTITAFTVERYIAICHPFLTQTMSKLSRAIKFVVAIWILALFLASPQAIQYGMYYAVDQHGNSITRCTMTRLLIKHAFEVSTLVFFVGPMTVIIVLYVLIAVKLRSSRKLSNFGRHCDDYVYQRSLRVSAAQNRVINMLVAVVIAFFLCWAPFHAQRLLAVHISNGYSSKNPPNSSVLCIYHILDYVSGILYFVSTSVNPIVYNIMSKKFRSAFKSSLPNYCFSSGGRNLDRTSNYSMASRYRSSLRLQQQQFPTCENSSYYSSKKVFDSTCVANNNPNNQDDIDICSAESNQITNNLECERHPSTRPIQRRFQYVHYKNILKKSEIHENQTGYNLSNITCHMKKINLFTRTTNDKQRYFVRQQSVDSANTISDASLEDLEDFDLKSSDLVQYMEEINNELI